MLDDLLLTGKTAIICGASEGIGRATAIRFATLGAKCILLSRSMDKLNLVKAELYNSEIHECYAVDFFETEKLKQIVSQIASQNNISIVLNNVGGPAAGPIALAEEEEFLKAFRMHILAAQTIQKIVSPKMKELNYGRFINVISTSVKQPIKGLGVSNTIRAAMANWSKTLSVELAPFGITVNNVLPGATLTGRLQSIIETKATKGSTNTDEISAEMKAEIPAARFADPSEIATAIAFLASPAASYINGINLPVDGGRTACL